MKTILYRYAILSLMVLAIFSCQNDDDTLPPQSQAEFTVSASEVAIGETIQFTNNSENATAYKWSFGDGTTSMQVSPTKSYTSSNVFLVSLVSTGSGGSTISNMEITVTPASSFSVEDEENLSAGLPVQFTNTSVGATSFSWNFGDGAGTTSAEENPAFTYASEGSYTVSLTATSAFGSNTSTKEITLAMAPEAPASLYYISLGDEFIRNLTLDGSGTTTDLVDLVGKGGVGLAYDATNEKIYFSDFDTYPFGNIWRADLDGANPETIVSGIGDPYAVQIDEVNAKVYWVDDDGNVSRANLDGSSPENVLNLPSAQWRALALDVENGKMYAYEVNNEDLYEANLDGSNPQIIISGIYGYAIAVDTVNDKVYFDDQNAGTFNVANLDGSNIQTVDTDGTRIYGIQIDNEDNKLYWSGRDSGELYRANLDGSEREVLASGLASPRGIVLIK
ncbi:PKD domain-containing protein [Subsaximicrobium wynnwilliamsii]|uniref:PKD domain-containing protein n=1 Tax=Subsaximicrobium wynnwilliamsii TaxID=291179 RepID=A0A5C6ZI18_9FLAO|nr:PKD domain-containing protein [Subsaximicrobium wynnwilliamsii]TXD83193.1 PKD domain-containing protein [Subsaximicrobium wynnwilliamsii]TXD88306.1 PKD domain-containing protein [Subsaximicrobium wynnwilliamsii]TXE03027.1 PKD domain-containing protein [Subsaximicrobium wynnwilliamsii]